MNRVVVDEEAQKPQDNTSGTIGMISSPLIAADTDFKMPSNTLISWMNGLLFGGQVIGGFLFGYVADRLASLVSLSISFCSTSLIFLALQLPLGIALGGHLSYDVIFFLEFTPSSKIKDLNPLIMLFGITGIMGKLIIEPYGWRNYMLAYSILSGCIFLLRILLFRFESPRYLLSKSKHNKVVKVINTMSRDCLLQDDCTIYVKQNKEVKKSKIMFKDVKVFFPLALQWFLVTLSYYGLILFIPTYLMKRRVEMAGVYDFYIVLAVSEIPGLVLTRLFLTKASYSTTLAANTFGCALSCLGLIFAKETNLIFFFNSLIYFFIIGCWTVLYTWTPTLIDVTKRGRIMSMISFIAKCAGILAAPFSSFLWSTFGNNADNHVSCAIVLGIFTVLFGAATVNGSLLRYNVK
ncbi:MFS general substrate transporter [Rozella allomycis CSF55]|uniref:MFS general substrate transporter n=1 Tax=Rozella allomycis (strain CSF55) TaxID=988480 RepID=A0A075AQY3_ROZAC|nr:Major facilitator superfamily, general substrate transporter domain-containing protein [Rozella allomycis CSF55]RKP20457.1 MFS general substrate transporter [Rozella allomycis CSF55]|eukprot:EPZ31095.1 Major facilitator superfamily, general substrate transporter domain-containing protein [Rozella allomycis CSF55]